MGTLGKSLVRREWKEIIDNLANKVLKEKLGIIKIVPAGSWRREKGIMNDLDLVIVTRDGKVPSGLEKLMVNAGYVKESLGSQLGRFIHIKLDAQIDIYSASTKNFGGMLIYLTGSKEFNIGMRTYSKNKGYLMNQDGIYQGSKLIAGSTEEEIFKILGCKVIPPRDRENWWTSYKRYKLAD